MGPNKSARLIVGRGLSPVFRDSEHIGAPTNSRRRAHGCVSSLWYDYQYRLDEGCAPSPFTEKLAMASLHEPAVADDQ